MTRVGSSLLLALILLFFPAQRAEACAIREGTAREWVDDADVIVRVRAIEQRGRRLTIEEARSQPAGFSSTTLGTTVRFEVLEVLKGSHTSPLEFDGELTDDAVFDENEPDVPRRGVRKGGRGGNCYALQYRPGQQYLLLLSARHGSLTPYWAAMAATNEHVDGPADPWLTWVRERLRRQQVIPRSTARPEL